MAKEFTYQKLFFSYDGGQISYVACYKKKMFTDFHLCPGRVARDEVQRQLSKSTEIESKQSQE